MSELFGSAVMLVLGFFFGKNVRTDVERSEENNLGGK